MKSMTGFGQSERKSNDNGITFDVEIFSVNRKQLDVRANLPREISFYEPLLRKIIAKRISRGMITVRVNLELSDNLLKKCVIVNEPLAAAYIRKCRNLQSHLDLPGEIQINDVLELPGVFQTGSPDFHLPEIEETFSNAVNEALDKLVSMRKTEGSHLKRDLKKRVKSLELIVQKINPLTSEIPILQKDRLLQKLNNANLDVDFDKDRILQEIIIFSDKSDVSEEITRLQSHLKQLLKFLEKKNEAIGRSLEFLIQEIYREITTLSNKAIHQEISILVVEFKTELEKIKEQIMNIE